MQARLYLRTRTAVLATRLCCVPFFALVLCLALCLASVRPAAAQTVSTTTVTGTVYLANGAPGSGTLQISWPAFTTAGGQAIAAGRTSASIGADGFVSLKLAPNVGAAPAGLFYTAVYHLKDGSTSTEYWVVPAAAQATIGQIRAQVMPAAQAVQAVSKTYVDQSISQAIHSQISPSGGTLTGPLFLDGDPSQPNQAATKHYVDGVAAQDLSLGGGVMTGPIVMAGDPTDSTQAANKHYVDQSVATALPLSGGTLSGAVTATQIGALVQADQLAGADFGAKLQACIGRLDATYGGTCDARNFTGTLAMGANLTVSTPNATIYLPCATIATASSIVVSAGTRNVTFHGCASRGASAASGSQGGTVFLYSGSSALLQVGDKTYATDTNGFHADNLAINTTAATAATAKAILAWRTQELTLSSLYLLGNGNQTGITLNGTGNYTGGTFSDIQLTGFQTGINGIGHQAANPATTDWVNASTFLRLHIVCPTSNGAPIAGTTGINLQAGDGNTFTGGDVESCATALHLGASAQNNTLVGVRNENSTTQVLADAGSAYNNWITGGTMFDGKLVDNGTRNSFLDTYHRSFNSLNGDWYGSQQDSTVTNHFRLGTGSGTERGLLNRYQTDYGYRWTNGISDASAGVQYYQILDELNNVYRLSIGQQNHGQPSANNQTVLNAAGTGAILLNGSAGSGTGGVLFGSGGSGVTTVASVDKSGNAQFNGALQVGGTAQSSGNITLRNSADAEVDYYLWPGLTATQKGAFTYKDYNGASQWYLVKDQYNNWALNSAVGGLDSFKAYQSSNSGDTYINASNSTGHIRLNYETGAGAETDIYSGSSSTLAAAFLGPTAIKFPGLASASSRNCLQIDNSGYLSNTGQTCGTAATVPATGLTFPDNSVQTTAQQGALTGLANDATARTAASGAQSTANAAQVATTAETTRAQAAEASVQTAAAAAQNAVGAEATRAQAAEGSIQSALSAETQRAQQAEAFVQSNTVIDVTARNAATAAQATANAALPAYGATSTGSGSSNVVTFPGSVAAGTTNGTPNIALQAGADVCAQTQNAVNGAAAGRTVQSTASGTQPNCASGLTINNPSVTLQYTAPGTTTWGGTVAVNTDNVRFRGMGGQNNDAATGTAWKWASGFSGVGLQVGDGIHSPQEFELDDIRLNGNSSMPLVADIKSGRSYDLHRPKVNCANQVGQTGLRLEDSAAGTNGWATIQQLKSTGCDVALDIEQPAAIADANHVFTNANIVAAKIGVYVGRGMDLEFHDPNAATTLASVPITGISWSGGTITVTTSARSPEIFNASGHDYVSLGGVPVGSGLTLPVNTVSFVAQDSCMNGLCTVTYNDPMPITAGKKASVQGMTWANNPSGATNPNGIVVVDSVSADAKTITYWKPGVANLSCTSSCSGKVAITPPLISSVSVDHTQITFAASQTNTGATQTWTPSPVTSTSVCKTGGNISASCVGTVASGMYIDYGERVSVHNGSLEYSAGSAASGATDGTAEPFGAMSVGVWETANSGSTNLDNVSTHNNDWPVLRQSSLHDSVTYASTGMWGQTRFELSRLWLGDLGAYTESQTSAGYTFTQCGSNSANLPNACQWSDPKGVAQFAVGTQGPWAMNQIRIGPYSGGSVLSATGNTVALTANGAGTWNGALNDLNSRGALQWGSLGGAAATYSGHRFGIGITPGTSGAKVQIQASGINGAVTFTGAGTMTATACGVYAGTDTSTPSYTAIIDGAGAPNTFKWREGTGSYTTGVAITGGCQLVADGVGFQFSGTTGGVVNDQWQYSVTVVPPATMCAANGSTCSQVNNDGTITSPGFSGPLTGNVTGNVTGNLTGNVAGNVTGNVSGSAGSVAGLSVTSGKTLTAGNTLTLAGTDGSTLNVGGGGALGSAAYQATTAFDVAGAASTVQAASLQKSNNLSDLANGPAARTNLGLGSAATQNTSAFDAAGAASTVQAAVSRRVGSLASPVTVNLTTSATTVATIASPALGANSAVKVYLDLSGASGNTGTLTVTTYLGASLVNSFPALSVANKDYELRWEFDNMGAVNSQRHTNVQNTTGSSAWLGGPSTTSVDTSTAQNIVIKLTPTSSSDSYTVNVVRVEVLP